MVEQSGRYPASQGRSAAPSGLSRCASQAEPAATNAMSDADLGTFLGLTEAEAAIIVPALTPEKRALYETMASIVADLNMGVTPPGVIVCRERKRGRYAQS